MIYGRNSVVLSMSALALAGIAGLIWLAFPSFAYAAADIVITDGLTLKQSAKYSFFAAAGLMIFFAVNSQVGFGGGELGAVFFGFLFLWLLFTFVAWWAFN